MIGWLRAIYDLVRRVLSNQDEAAGQAAADLAEVESRLTSLEVLVSARTESLSAAVEHLRALVEDSDNSPAAVGAPTFTPTQGEHQ